MDHRFCDSHLDLHEGRLGVVDKKEEKSVRQRHAAKRRVWKCELGIEDLEIPITGTFGRSQTAEHLRAGAQLVSFK